MSTQKQPVMSLGLSKNSCEVLKVSQLLQSVVNGADMIQAAREMIGDVCAECDQNKSKLDIMNKKLLEEQAKIKALESQVEALKSIVSEHAICKGMSLQVPTQINGTNANKVSGYIRLNVSGRLFETITDVLFASKEYGTFFHTLLSTSVEKTLDDSGNIFIDRDPMLFAYILCLLRNDDDDMRHRILQVVPSELLIQLPDELQYYGYDHLLEQVDPYRLRLEQISLQYKTSSANNELLHDHVEFKVSNEPDYVFYTYTPIDISSYRLITLGPLVFNLSEHDDPRKFNYVEIRFNSRFNSHRIGIQMSGNANRLGSKKHSFGFDHSKKYNNAVTGFKKYLSLYPEGKYELDALNI